MVFDMLTITTALYAVTYVDVPRPIDAHLYLAQAVLPSVAKGIFVGGIFAAVLSTLDGYAIVHGMTLGRDIIDAWRGRSATVASFRIGIVIAGIAAVIMSIALPSVIGLFMSLAGYTVPGLLMPLVLSYSRYAPLLVGGAAMRMVVPSVAVITADVLTDVALPTTMLAALVVSACWHLGIISWRKGRP
jgi:Na+/proline symporter